ncbi:PDZ domain-containing protein [Desulfurivibrio dismutans]|uniref:PDZ domain-containing protein n=1 Tax=Desulfurivibrio dismutans TaxID=1398908 RepID=UPI0023DCB327|nr:PDZ domain-containing protein [Desulfurivibrio alkaliphilus]MDF1615782.1 PDZ domain-containing protein [Desulfurivibrio alkaliphilus]
MITSLSRILVIVLFIGVTACQTTNPGDIVGKQPAQTPPPAAQQTQTQNTQAQKEAEQPLLFQEYCTPERLAETVVVFDFSGNGSAFVSKHSGFGDTKDEISHKNILWRYDQSRGGFVKTGLELEGNLSSKLSWNGDIWAYTYYDPKSSTVVTNRKIKLLSTVDGTQREIEVPRVRSINVPGGDFSRDGRYFAVFLHDLTSRGIVAVFDVATTEKIGEVSLTVRPEIAQIVDVFLDPLGRYLAVSKEDIGEWLDNPEREVSSRVSVFSLPGLTRLRVHEQPGKFSGFSPDGNYLLFAPLRTAAPVNVIHVTSGKRLSVPENLQHPVYSGGMDRLVKLWNSGFDEYLMHDDKIILLQTKRFREGSDLRQAVYVESANTWFGGFDFGRGGSSELYSMKSAPDEVVQAAKAVAEGEGLIVVGFKSNGIGKIKEGIAASPLYSRLRTFPFFDELAEKGLSKAELADLLLFHHQKLMEVEKSQGSLGVRFKDLPGARLVEAITNADGPAASAGLRVGDVVEAVDGINFADRQEYLRILNSKPAGSSFEFRVNRNGQTQHLTVSTVTCFADRLVIDRAGRRLFEYGFLAFSSGYPDLALNAASRLRSLRTEYPVCLTDNSWEMLLKSALALEAMVMAYRGEVDRAYEYLLEQGGLVHQGNTFAALYILNYPDYWFPLYADPRRLSFLLDKKPDELARPSTNRIAPQPYPDLSGRLVEPVAAPPQLPSREVAPSEQVEETAQPRGRVLD